MSSVVHSQLSHRRPPRPRTQQSPRLPILAALAAASLAVEPAAFAVTGGGGGGYESEQGPSVLGTRGDALDGVQLPFAPAHATSYDRLRFDTGQLHLQRGGADVAGAGVAGIDIVGTRTLGSDAGKPITLRIAAARPHKNIYTGELSQQVFEYDIKIVDGSKQTPLCDDGANAALAVPGFWKSGAPTQPDQWFSFACVPLAVPAAQAGVGKLTLQPIAHYTVVQRRALGLPVDEIEGPRWPGGAAAKCIDYGYAPWPSGVAAIGKTTRTEHKVASSAAAASRFHNLCTRAMTADYQHDGHSHTIPGTLIRIFDLTNLPIDLCRGLVIPAACTLVPPSQPTAPPATVQRATTVEASIGQFQTAEVVAPEFASLFYESVWEVDGSGIARAVCLAKLRWQTIDALHVSQVQSSPAKRNPSDTDWQYCDDRTVGSFRDHDTAPVLFVYSAINEKGLYRFDAGPGPGSGHWLTTTHVQAGKRGIELAAGMPCTNKPCLAINFEGDVLSPDEPAETRKGWATVPLFLYRNSAGEFATAVRDGSVESPRLPTSYKGFEPPRPPPAAAAAGSGDKPDPAKSRPEPALASTAKASIGAGNTAGIALLLAGEGYLFKDPPALPSASGLAVSARSSLLHWYKIAGGYCMALDACDGSTAEGHGVGYVLLPEATMLARIPILATRPGIPDHQGDPVDRSAPVAR